MRFIDADSLIKMRFSGGYNDDGTLLVPYRDVITAINQAPTAFEWISTKDRLPEKADDVLFYTALPTFEIGYFDGVEWYSDVSFDRDEVTHWMPLPKPPKEA